jgi:IS30 family transposase
VTPTEFMEAAITLYGRKHWARELAKALGVDPSTIHRQLRHEQIHGVYEVAIRGLLQNKQANAILERSHNADDRHLPRGYKAWNKKPRKKQTAEQRKQRRRAILDKYVDRVVARAKQHHPQSGET